MLTPEQITLLRAAVANKQPVEWCGNKVLEVKEQCLLVTWRRDDGRDDYEAMTFAFVEPQDVFVGMALLSYEEKK
jgi:hypothetical protein